MIFITKFLHPLFVFVTFTLCCSGVAFAGAIIDPQIITTQTNDIIICPKGEYVAACGRYVVGFNWLKNASFPYEDEEPQENEDPQYYKTYNYYTSDDVIDLFKTMRVFFGNETGALDYTTAYGDPNATSGTAQPEVIINDRDMILNNLCHPSKVTPKCEPCPNGTVPESKFTFNPVNRIISAWEVYTIADCYRNEFEDSTGSYVYLPEGENLNIEDIPSSNHPAEKCYYTNTNPAARSVLEGTAIGVFDPDFTPSVTPVQLTIPSSFKLNQMR